MTENTNKRRPSHTIYTVAGDGPGAEWQQIGLAFPHKDGLGLALVLKEQFTGGRITLRVIPEAPSVKPVQPLQMRLPMQQPPIVLPDPRRRLA